ncbi:MAG: Nramp family divalent metal transporter [Gemmatimonadales bacterium]
MQPSPPSPPSPPSLPARTPPRFPRLALFAPGMLIAATGVGAGDLLTASLAGSRHGLALLWAAWIGALLKWFLNEGIARWQMATGTTLVEGWVAHLGRWAQWAFLVYLLPWGFFTAGALASACGVAGTGLLPLAHDPDASKIAWGIAHSVVGGLLVWRGGFRLFERVMAVCVVLMVAGVVLTAPLLHPDWAALLDGLFAPRIPAGGTVYALGVLGGVGGTVTLLSYGYWIRERGRSGARGAFDCRIDLAGAYALTALFGMAMIVIGSRVTLRQGPTAALELADQLAIPLGAPGRWIFLLGFWGAVFSSLLGVWQGIPYLFADFVALSRSRATPGPAAELSASVPYRGFLVFLSTAPLVLLWAPLERAQLLYAVFGAFFMPLLALTLLIMNTRTAWVGRDFRNGWVTNLVLLTTLAVFAYLGWGEAAQSLRKILG